MEMARFDASMATFVGVHSGLAMGSIYMGGSEEQKKQWLPPMARMEKIGCFGLTEPLVGSGTGGGLTTTAKREGDTWVINGQKKWIGNAPWCDVSIIWARDVADNQVKGFIVENNAPGFSVEKIQNKIALKVVQNGLITLNNCRIPEENRLQQDSSFRDTAKVLRMTRFLPWGGRPPGARWVPTKTRSNTRSSVCSSASRSRSFQLVQDLLAKMLANVTACQCMVARTAQLNAEGKLTRRTCGPYRRRLRPPGCAKRLHGGASCSAAMASPRLSGSAILRGCRGVLFVRRHVSDAEPDRR